MMHSKLGPVLKECQANFDWKSIESGILWYSMDLTRRCLWAGSRCAGRRWWTLIAPHFSTPFLGIRQMRRVGISVTWQDVAPDVRPGIRSSWKGTLQGSKEWTRGIGGWLTEKKLRPNGRCENRIISSKRTSERQNINRWMVFRWKLEIEKQEEWNVTI